MRFVLIAAALLLGACAQQDDRRQGAVAGANDDPPLTAGEERARIAPHGEQAATLRSGSQVPVTLPPGFTLYPGARVIANTIVERAGVRRILLTFETPNPLPSVMRFYRGQAAAAGASLAFDMGANGRASLGGTTAAQGAFVVTARQDAGITRVELSAG